MVKFSSLAVAVLAALPAPGIAKKVCKPKTTYRTTTITTTSTTTSTVTTGPVTTGPDPSSSPDCVFRPQGTWTLTNDPQCAFRCPTPNPFCIADAAVTLPCGCTNLTIRPTTTSVCATGPQDCRVQCSTGWGFITFTASGCQTPAPTAP
ncbi:hypothetical protein VTJ83DRAFT_6706 [Remersonia thermophila]|uniref:Uncharacterized protein n=1 Tax=Remersonia thermophila TaxID=72144 RepID=A0ABR4D5G1_9PEZI